MPYPWYRQAWPWLLMVPPAGAVIGGIITVIMALQSPNPLVVGDYYKEGLAINQDQRRFATARAMQLIGQLHRDTASVSVTLSSAVPITDNTLVLHLVHATRPDLDRTVLLQRDRLGAYRAPLPALKAGRWYLSLRNPQQTWEIRTRLMLDGPFQAYLTPAS